MNYDILRVKNMNLDVVKEKLIFSDANGFIWIKNVKLHFLRILFSLDESLEVYVIKHFVF